MGLLDPEPFFRQKVNPFLHNLIAVLHKIIKDEIINILSQRSHEILENQKFSSSSTQFCQAFRI